MLERRRARSTSRRMEPAPIEGLRESSLCIPALRAAAAARECGGVWEAGGDVDMVRVGVDSLFDAERRAWSGEPEPGDGDGGRELRSGGMVLRPTSSVIENKTRRANAANLARQGCEACGQRKKVWNAQVLRRSNHSSKRGS